MEGRRGEGGKQRTQNMEIKVFMMAQYFISVYQKIASLFVVTKHYCDHLRQGPFSGLSK